MTEKKLEELLERLVALGAESNQTTSAAQDNKVAEEIDNIKQRIKKLLK